MILKLRPRPRRAGTVSGMPGEARRKAAASRVPSRRPPEGLSARFREASVATYGPASSQVASRKRADRATPGRRDGTAGAVSGTSEQTRSERRSSHRHAPTRDDMTQQLRRHGPSRPDPQYSVASALTRKRSALAGRADLQDGACHPDDLPEGATTRPPVGRAWRGR